MKMGTDDQNLLRQYAERHSEEAFAALVTRHLNLVYSAALRLVRSPQLAEEVAQSVFTDLARNARKLKHDTTLPAWLYRVAYRTAVDVIRKESRRQNREQKAVEMAAMNSESSDWTHIEPLLDEGMQTLDETDRVAVLLRYFENKSLREVGQQLGVSDDTAQKRVSRAVERLREIFAKRGVTVAAGGLAIAVSTNAVQAAPAGLATAISAGATLAGASIAATTTTATITKAIAMTTLQKTIIGATLAVAIGTGVYEAHQNSKLRDQDESLQQQVAQMKGEREVSAKRLAALTRAQSDKALPDEQFNELAQLRGDRELLRRQNSELEKRLADTSNPKPQDQNPPAQSPPTAPLPADYPKTPDDATRSIFGSWARGDWDSFFTNFEVDGGREFWDQAINDEMKSNLLDMEVVSIGEPTNSFAPNMWFVPYTIRFQNGSEKSLRLHVAQDPKTQRWILKGGF